MAANRGFDMALPDSLKTTRACGVAGNPLGNRMQSPDRGSAGADDSDSNPRDYRKGNAVPERPYRRAGLWPAPQARRVQSRI